MRTPEEERAREAFFWLGYHRKALRDLLDDLAMLIEGHRRRFDTSVENEKKGSDYE